MDRPAHIRAIRATGDAVLSLNKASKPCRHLFPSKIRTLRGTDFDADRLRTCGETECLCCISTKISNLVGAGPDARNYSDGTFGSHPRDLAGLSLRSHDKGNCRTPGRTSRQYQLAAEQARCLWGYQKDPGQNRSQCFGMCHLSCADIRAFNQSALHGSNKPRHTTKPSKIRDVHSA
jgi:hypothetical protein